MSDNSTTVPTSSSAMEPLSSSPSSSKQQDEGDAILVVLKSKYHSGDVVNTLYGVGVIVQVRGGTDVESSHTSTNQQLDGTTSSTVDDDKKSLLLLSGYVVRLWRLPGKSVASSALAYLNETAIRALLPVAPGMIATLDTTAVPSETAQEKGNKEKSRTTFTTPYTKFQSPVKVLVQCYYSDRKQMIVSPWIPKKQTRRRRRRKRGDNNNNNKDGGEEESAPTPPPTPPPLPAVFQRLPLLEGNLYVVTVDQINTSPSAKLYPVLETLMKRADKVASLAKKRILSSISKKKKVEGDESNDFEEEDRRSNLSSEDEDEEENDDEVDEPDANDNKDAEEAGADMEIDPSNPTAVIQQQIVKIMQDEQVAQLLKQFRERLQQLIEASSNNSGDLAAKTKQALEKSGIRFRTEFAKHKQQHLDQQKSQESLDEQDQEDGENKKPNPRAMIAASRKAALAAIDELLLSAKIDVKGEEIKETRQQLLSKFTKAFDALATVARSDRALLNLFESINEKTRAWQEATGRLLQTKSGSLFLESASRFHSRARAILGQSELRWASNVIASKLTKSFTEGDAAIARLKSIQLGEAIKSRLVEAIQVRSESLGGLDGIIAGALAGVASENEDETEVDPVEQLLSTLQKQASKVTKNARETLLSVLSTHSKYRDVALLRIERVLCEIFDTSIMQTDKDTQVSTMTSDEIMALVQGKAGTAKLFQFMTRRAMAQINRQLDKAEQQVHKDNKTAHAVLQRIRQIMSGELTFSAVMNELVTLLDDENVVKTGQKIAQRGEQVLDAIEGVSGTKAVADVLKMAEKAGLNKDSFLTKLDSLDVDQLLDTASDAVKDERARRKLLSSATDTALDFCLRVLPSMKVPPFDGVKDGLVYHLSNLSMEGFRVRKEDIQIELAGMRATKHRRKANVAEAETKTTDTLETGSKTETDETRIIAKSNTESEEKAEAELQSTEESLAVDADSKPASAETGEKATTGTEQIAATDENDGHAEELDATPLTNADKDVLEKPDTSLLTSRPSSVSTTSEETMIVEEVASSVKSTELLIIDVSNISATLNSAEWSFEQTYMPYLRGNGTLDVALSGGAIRLQFELRKRKKSTPQQTAETTESKEDTEEDVQQDAESQWEPVLCLHDHTCSISDVSLVVNGKGTLTWIVNQLASVFKGPLRDYVVRTIDHVMTNRSGWILERMNKMLSNYWPLVLRTAHLTMDDLAEADERDVVAQITPFNSSLVELVWREQLPLGMNLLLNDPCGKLKVIDFPRGTQARVVCLQRKLDPESFEGALIVGVNGHRYDDREDFLDALRDPSRPKTIQFQLVKPEEAQQDTDTTTSQKQPVTAQAANNEPEKRLFGLRKVDFMEAGSIGVEFGNTPDGSGLLVCGFVKGPDGSMLPAEKSGLVELGDVLTHVNDEVVIDPSGSSTMRSSALEKLQSAANERPLALTFCEPYLHLEVIKKPSTDDVTDSPSELILKEQVGIDSKTRIQLAGFKGASGAIELSGVLIGDHLVSLNSERVRTGANEADPTATLSFEKVRKMVNDAGSYPLRFGFCRPKRTERYSYKSEQPLTSAEEQEAGTTFVEVEERELLGCIFSNTREGDIVVNDFRAIPGRFQRQLRAHEGRVSLAIDSINGEFVPSYASAKMVQNALNRAWKGGADLQLLFCDDELRSWLTNELAPEKANQP